MKQHFILTCLLSLLAVGCANPTDQPKNASLYAFTQWPLCQSATGNPESNASMNDTRTSCTSCDLISPCRGANGIIYSWYSPQICNLCAANCPQESAVGTFCNIYYGGTCVHTINDKGPAYTCADGLTYDAGTHAAYGKAVDVSAYCGGRYSDSPGTISYYQSCPI